MSATAVTLRSEIETLRRSTDAVRVESILDTVGNTPLVRIRNLAPKHVRLYAKVEAFNPMGSVKDRMAKNTIETAEKSGLLKPGQTVIEATSGNTGIGLAMVCAAKGYPLVIVMSESFSLERRKILRFLGAKVVLTPAHLKGSGMTAKARELAQAHDWFWVQQFENEANAEIHSLTTANEILDAMGEDALDYFVTGYGTGGTLKGTARALRELSPDTQIIACEPDNTPVLSSGIPQPKGEDGQINESHPMFRPHPIQGWGPDFIPKLTEDAVAMELIDQIQPINGQDALEMARALAVEEGIFAGTSSGATLAAAIKIAEKAPEGSTIVCMLPDTGERYLSTMLFDHIEDDMNDEEWAVSRSTANGRFDSPPPSAPAKPSAAQGEVTAEAKTFFSDTIAQNPVVLFSLEWCEFCWSVRRFFKEHGIPYQSVDLDSVAYQENNWGGEVRKALNAHTGCVTVPQIFIGGEFVGGCSELFGGVDDGSLVAKLEAVNIQSSVAREEDPNRFLPKWIHARG